MKNINKGIKNFAMIASFAVIILILVLSIIDVSTQKISGGAFYRPIKIYGKVYPRLPNGTEIDFRIGDRVTIASTILKNNKYGYDPEISFKMDDPSTVEIEGYSKDNTVNIFIEDVKIGEISYFPSWENQKNIIIPASKRATISAKTANLTRCIPNWKCSEWTGCINSSQTRNCTDINNCNSLKGKPNEKRSCKTPSLETTQKTTTLSKEMIFLFLFNVLLIAFMIRIVNKVNGKNKD